MLYEKCLIETLIFIIKSFSLSFPLPFSSSLSLKVLKIAKSLYKISEIAKSLYKVSEIAGSLYKILEVIKSSYKTLEVTEYA